MLFCLKIFIFFSFSRRFNDDNGDRIEGVSRVGSRRNFVVNTVDGKKKRWWEKMRRRWVATLVEENMMTTVKQSVVMVVLIVDVKVIEMY